MRVLIGCERSGVVRRAFEARGHYAVSCDTEPSDDDAPDYSDGRKRHVRCDVLEILDSPCPLWLEGPRPRWDLAIFHPPCTDLAVSGARWFKDKRDEQEAALEFVRALLAAPIERIALENPVSVISSKIRRPDQIIQPWMFGHGETKATCLWLKGLSKLQPTSIVEGRKPRIHHMAPGKNRARDRSRTYVGIAEAMADQWGLLGR